MRVRVCMSWAGRFAKIYVGVWWGKMPRWGGMGHICSRLDVRRVSTMKTIALVFALVGLPSVAGAYDLSSILTMLTSHRPRLP